MQISGFLGSVGGIYHLLIQTFMFLFGGYLSFSTKISWINNMYNYYKENDPDDHGVDKEGYILAKNDVDLDVDGNLRINICRKLILYIKNYSSLGWLLQCFNSAHEDRYIDIIEAGQDKIDEDLDFKNISIRSRFILKNVMKLFEHNKLNFSTNDNL